MSDEREKAKGRKSQRAVIPSVSEERGTWYMARGTWHMALFFTLFVFASSLSAQPERMWQRSGVPNGATQLVVEPTSGVMAFTKGTDEWSQVMIRYPDGEVQTRDLPGAEPTLYFLDEQTLLIFSLEMVAEVNTSTRTMTRLDRWSPATFVGENFLGPEYTLSADGEEVLISMTVDADSMEQRCLRMNTRTLELLDNFVIAEWDRKATFLAPTTDYLFYDRNEVFVNGEVRMALPSGHRILTLQAMNERCWVLHYDSTTTALWLTHVLLDTSMVVEQRQMLAAATPWISRDLQIADDHLILTLERDVYVLDPITLGTRALLKDVALPSTISLNADGGFYLNRSRDLIEVNRDIKPVSTIARVVHSIYSFAQDRRSQLFGAQQRLVEVDPLTGRSTAASAGPFTNADNYATDHIVADPSSDRFAMMVTNEFNINTIYVFDGPDRETLQFKIEIGNSPDPVVTYYEPLWSPVFIPGTNDVLIASSCLLFDHFNMVERFTPTSDTIAPERFMVRMLDEHLGIRFTANTDGTRFMFSPSTSAPAIYHPASASFITDHPQGVQLFPDDPTNPSPPIELGERMIPLCASANGAYVLGWLDSTSRVALFNVETSTIIWRNEPTARPTAAHLDIGGAWFVISYGMGVTEGYVLDSLAIKRDDTPRPLVQVAPNPSMTSITLVTDDQFETIDAWQVFDRNGILVLSGTGTSVNITSLSSGSYSALVRSGTAYTSVAFVVMR